MAARSENAGNAANFVWRVPVPDLKRGFGVKTTSKQFIVKQAPFVVDVYVDGAHEEHRGCLAAYVYVSFIMLNHLTTGILRRYVGREKAIRVQVRLPHIYLRVCADLHRAQWNSVYDLRGNGWSTGLNQYSDETGYRQSRTASTVSAFFLFL